MADAAAIKRVIDNLKGDRLFSAGVIGSTSNKEDQINRLRKAFAVWCTNQSSEQNRQQLLEALLVACTLAVISQKEFELCEEALE